MTTELGKRILARRTMLNIRQKDLAASSGLSVSYVSMVERGDRIPHLATIQKFACALQTTASALVSNDVVADATKASDSVESLVSYLLARNATPEQVRKVEALARVLLEAA